MLPWQGFYTIFKAEVKNYFEELVSDLDSVWYGYYFAEIAEYYGKENLDAAQMLNLLYVSFKALTNKSIPNELIRFIYELRMISINGECPDFLHAGAAVHRISWIHIHIHIMACSAVIVIQR